MKKRGSGIVKFSLFFSFCLFFNYRLTGNTWQRGGVIKVDTYIQANGENPFDEACDD